MRWLTRILIKVPVLIVGGSEAHICLAFCIKLYNVLVVFGANQCVECHHHINLLKGYCLCRGKTECTCVLYIKTIVFWFGETSKREAV